MKNETQFKIRLPAEIKNWVERRAEENMRSQSAEILAVLKSKMSADQTQKTDAEFLRP